MRWLQCIRWNFVFFIQCIDSCEICYLLLWLLLLPLLLLVNYRECWSCGYFWCRFAMNWRMFCVMWTRRIILASNVIYENNQNKAILSRFKSRWRLVVGCICDSFDRLPIWLASHMTLSFTFEVSLVVCLQWWRMYTVFVVRRVNWLSISKFKSCYF